MYRKILTAIDGSAPAARGGDLAIALARATGAELLACHVYSAGLHSRRFQDMEPGLPEKYQDNERLGELRGMHGSLIEDGFQALSGGYLDEFVTAAGECDVPVTRITEEGRNFVRILEIAERVGADLIVLGAQGLGAVGDGLLGSTTARVLRHATCDVLVARSEAGDGCVLAGVDGSAEAIGAVEKAASWARVLERPLRLAAAYDPQFHVEVFRAMGRSLSSERQEQVGLAQQEQLHEDLIDDGLAKLYTGFLDEAKQRLTTADGVETALLQGKAYRALSDEAQRCGAGLLVVGRFGHHREAESLVGSNAEALVRLSGRNVLVTACADAPAKPQAVETAATASSDETAPGIEMIWDDDALARLERIPSFARPMARRAIEQAARDAGADRVTLDVFEQTARRFGMGGGARGDA